MRSVLGSLVAASLALLTASPATAQDTPASDAAQASTKQPTKKKPQDWGFRLDEHPTWHFGKGNHVSFRARFQRDVRRSDAPFEEAGNSTADAARKRIGVQGEIKNAVEFEVDREATGADPWRDVFVNYKQFAFIQVQGGKFKLPFSLDENTGATNLDFVYRSLAANLLAPGRDRGFMVHGRVVSQIIRYEYGRFDHDGRNARGGVTSTRVYGGKTTAGRISVQPFRQLKKSPLEDLQVGYAFTQSDVPEGFSALRGKLVMDQRFFSSDYLVNGARQRRGFELRWRPGPFSVKSEYITVSDERLGESVEDTDLSTLDARGWYVSGTFAVTGEKKVDGLDIPKRPLLKGGFGAVEVGVRVERLTFDSAPTGDIPSTSIRSTVVIPNSDRAVTFGVTWHPVRFVKIQVNFIKETLDDPSQGPLPDQPSFWSRVFRFQFSL